MVIGFSLICLAAMAGAFIAQEATEAFVKDPSQLAAWGFTLRKSSHAHTNLFGMLHIVFGLTLPYSGMGIKIKRFQTLGLAAGSVAMSVGMILRAQFSSPSTEGWLDYGVAACLSLALVALMIHVTGLSQALFRR